MKVADLLDYIESIAPSRWATDYDNVGLLFGDPNTEIQGIVFALDITLDLIQFAEQQGANVLLTHHPILWEGTKSITPRTQDGKLILAMAKAGMTHICSHTNWDAAPGGINCTLAEVLGLQDVYAFGYASPVSYCKIAVYTPHEFTEAVIDAMANAGAGHIGAYRRCAFKGAGTGTFEPLEGADPFVGRAGKTTEVEEHRIEMLCPKDKVKAVIAAMVAEHPYEQPAFDVIELKPIDEQPFARMGTLPTPMTLREFRDYCDKALETRAMVWGDESAMIQKVAVVGGAADGEFKGIKNEGADVFVTGEVRHHISIESGVIGLPIIAAGHFATENPGMKAYRKQFETAFPEVGCHFFEPFLGSAGRPLA